MKEHQMGCEIQTTNLEFSVKSGLNVSYLIFFFIQL